MKSAILGLIIFVFTGNFIFTIAQCSDAGVCSVGGHLMEQENKNLFNILNKLEDELRFVLITSTANIFNYSELNQSEATIIEENKLALEVLNSKHSKCVRCWHYREDVGSDSKHPELCSRCIENVDTENGENRKYA